jgi:hypothetical protein
VRPSRGFRDSTSFPSPAASRPSAGRRGASAASEATPPHGRDSRSLAASDDNAPNGAARCRAARHRPMLAGDDVGVGRVPAATARGLRSSVCPRLLAWAPGGRRRSVSGCSRRVRRGTPCSSGARGRASSYLLWRLGVPRERIIERLRDLGVPTPRAPLPEQRQIEWGPRVWFDRTEVRSVVDYLRARIPPGTRWGFNYADDRAWAIAEAHVDLPARVSAAIGGVGP